MNWTTDHPGREQLRRIRPLLPAIRPLTLRNLVGPILLPPPVGAPTWRLGDLRILATVQPASDGSEWYHVSYSYADRLPSHEDTCLVRMAMFRPEVLVVAVFPPVAEYVNEHPFCLHLWQRLGDERLIPDLRVSEGGSRPTI